MRASFSLLTFAPLLTAFSSCHKTAEPILLSYFKPATLTDTLRFECRTEETPTGDTIPNALFFSALDTAWLREIEHVADAAGAVVYGKKRFAISDEHEACLVDIRQGWFEHQSLLLFDKKKNAFTGRTTVAEWYGGDGGQVLTGSWLLDFDGNGSKDLVRRELEHWLLLAGDEARDSTSERAELLLWKAGRFVPSPTPDSAALVRRFPIKSYW